MGRFDKLYDQHTRDRITELIVDQRLGPTPAVAILKDETGITMPIDTARKIADSDRRKRTPKLEQANPIAPMVDRLLRLYNEELHGIECKRTKTDADLERAGKITKALIDLDRLRKANQAPTDKPKDTSPLAQLARSNGTQNPTQNHSNSGSVSDTREPGLVQPVASGPV